ncbi:hypothetical protein Rhal01_00587 [Rubritalea halochordaticola]|uniref:DUF3300 domain-containing protein n=1 Tax=Rubritalea halochordaticola TaxID=714537 RepID=A0ABP9UVD2_9BACT
MKWLAIIFVLSFSSALAEQEVWYNADGEPVRVTEQKDKPEEIYVPPWVRRKAEKNQSAIDGGKVRWSKSRTSGRYSGNYYLYPGFYRWGYPRYDYHCRRPHYHYGGRWGFYYRGSGVSIHYRR